jgi:hypothetical protein
MKLPSINFKHHYQYSLAKQLPVPLYILDVKKLNSFLTYIFPVNSV